MRSLSSRKSVAFQKSFPVTDKAFSYGFYNAYYFLSIIFQIWIVNLYSVALFLKKNSIYIIFFYIQSYRLFII